MQLITSIINEQYDEGYKVCVFMYHVIEKCDLYMAISLILSFQSHNKSESIEWLGLLIHMDENIAKHLFRYFD